MKFTGLFARPGVRLLAGVVASTLLMGLYARGGAGWVLGFAALVPWLCSLDRNRTLAGAMLSGWAMSMGFTVAAFGWFGTAIGQYAQIGTAAGLAVLLVSAPLFQPQFIVFALVRHLTGRRHGPMLRALAGCLAWVAAEWLYPKLLGDTLGYGLYPSRLLRQAADVGGTAGLTLLLLFTNEAIVNAMAQRAHGTRAMARPLALAALVPLALAGYGVVALSSSHLASPERSGKPLRVGLVQSNIVEYDRLRRERSAEEVLRDILDTHFAMSYDAIERQHADAVLWTETVYPLTFGHPKTEAGAEFDREILEIVRAAKVPFVFGTYDVDGEGEYNAAAFVTPEGGLLGFYRKTRLFAFTEYVPAWIDSPTLRQWLPWTGAWRPGTGARVFPLRLKDGREIPVLPMICLDDVDTGLAIEGVRQGAQAILTMSNDSWFTADPLGAEMHQTAAAFRSIETRLPQFRVTSNGHSAAIDATGTVVAGTQMGERTLVIGDLPVGEPARTVMMAWGDWVGRAAAVFLVLLAMTAVLRRWWAPGIEDREPADAAALPASVVLLPPSARLATAWLRILARGSLLWMAVAFLIGGGLLPSNTLALIRMFTVFFLVPELAAWLMLHAFAARAALENGVLALTRGRRRLELPIQGLVDIQPWRLPVPGRGVWLRLASGERHGLMHAHPVALMRVLAAAGGPAALQPAPTRARLYTHVLSALRRGRLGHPLIKFGVLPLLLAIPAFRAHQVVAFGGSFGEYQEFGLAAYLLGFALWWSAWLIGVVVTAAGLRALIEAGTLMALTVRPGHALAARGWLERFGLAVLYLGMPAWLAMRTLGS